MKRQVATTLLVIPLCFGCASTSDHPAAVSTTPSPASTGQPASTASNMPTVTKPSTVRHTVTVVAQPSVKAITRMIVAIKPGSLPETSTAADEVLSRLPATLDGHRGTASGGHEFSYGPGFHITAAPLAEAAGPDMAMAPFFHRFMTSGEFAVQAQSPAGGTLLWFVATSTEPPGQAFVALASSNGKWLYGFKAPDRLRLQRLLATFSRALVPR